MTGSSGTGVRTPWPVRLALIGFGVLLIAALDLVARWVAPLPEAGAHASSGFAGAPPAFVLERTEGGTAEYVVHPARRHSFPPQRFAAVKAPGSVRVFCIGGSSVYGYPHGADFAFPHRLGILLRQAHPDVTFEVVNVGGMSYGSERLALLTEELERYEPDVLVVYTGHNEYAEADAVRIGRMGGWLTAVRGLARGSHLYCLAEAALTPEQTPAELAGGSMFGIDVRRREDRTVHQSERDAALGRYRQNLERIVATAQAGTTTPVLCTTSSNLSGWRPGSGSMDPALSQAQVLELALQWAQARDAAGEPEQALAHLETALALDPQYARLCYRAAEVAAGLGRFERARQLFVAARENDPTPIRASESFNDQVRAVAAENGLGMVDVEALFDHLSPHAIPGPDLFLDYCHPNAVGHELVARALQGPIEVAAGLPVTAADPRDEPLPASSSPYDQDDGYVLWWLGNVEMRQGRPAAALPLLRTAVQAKHGEYRPLVSLGQALWALGRREEALTALRQAVSVAPRSVLAQNTLGSLLTSMGRTDEALEVLSRALELDPASAAVHNNLASAHLRRSDALAALEHIDQALRLHPNLQGVHRNQGLALLLRQDGAGAAAAFLEELRRNPEDRRSAVHLARCLAATGDTELARLATRLALALAPGDADTRALAQSLGLEGDASEQLETRP